MYTERGLYRGGWAVSTNTIPYVVDVEKAIGVETWTNVYYVAAASRAEALVDAAAIAQVERFIHCTDVTFTRVRVRQVSQLASAGSQQVIGQQGLFGSNANLPLFVCTRVLFTQSDSRPSVKYLRGCAGATEAVNRFFWTTGYMNQVSTEYCVRLAQLTFLRSKDGAPFQSFVPQPKIAEHQLRRGSKRRLVPVLG